MITAVALVAALHIGCRSDSTQPGQQDASVTPHDGNNTTQDDANPNPGNDGGGGQYDYANVKALLAAPPALQTIVTVERAAIIAIQRSSTAIKDTWIMDEDGGAKSGIALFCPATGSSPCAVDQTFMKTLRAGMRVKVVGKFDQYKGKNEIKPTSITILDNSAIGALPPANNVTAAQVAETLMSSDYQGTLVNVTGGALNVTSVTPLWAINGSYDGGVGDCTKGPSYSAWEVSDGISTVAVESTFYYDMDLTNDAACVRIFDGGTPSAVLVAVGGSFSKLGGVLDIDTYTGKMVVQPNSNDVYTYTAP
jgi:hypothetical protein